MNFEHIIAVTDPACTPQGVYYLTLAYEDEDGRTTTAELLLTDERAVALVKRLLSGALRRLPKPAEAKEAMEALKGAALERPRRAATSLPSQEVELPPLGRVVAYVSTRSPGTYDNGRLLTLVTNVARQLEVLDEDPKFPTGVDALGKQLGGLVQPLAEVGVRLERQDTSRPREWTIHPKDEAPEDPAGARKQYRERVGPGVQVSAGTESRQTSSGEDDTSDTSEGVTAGEVAQDGR